MATNNILSKHFFFCERIADTKIIQKLVSLFCIFPTLCYAPVIWLPPPPFSTTTTKKKTWRRPGESGDNHLILTSLCFPRGRVNTRFPFFVVWFSDGSKSSRGVSDRTTSSRVKIRLTSSRMSGGFTFNLSVVAFLCHSIIWTFDINYFFSKDFGGRAGPFSSDWCMFIDHPIYTPSEYFVNCRITKLVKYKQICLFICCFLGHLETFACSFIGFLANCTLWLGLGSLWSSGCLNWCIF